MYNVIRRRYTMPTYCTSNASSSSSSSSSRGGQGQEHAFDSINVLNVDYGGAAGCLNDEMG